MRLLAILTTMLLLYPLLAAPVPKDSKKAPPIDGTWEVVERHLDGKRDDSTSTIRWTIHGESLVIEMQRKNGTFHRVQGTTHHLVKPEGGKANQLDYIVKQIEIGIPPSTFRGLYEIDGDTLKICTPHSAGQDRPTECKSMADTDLYVLKRVKDEKKDK